MAAIDFKEEGKNISLDGNTIEKQQQNLLPFGQCGNAGPEEGTLPYIRSPNVTK